MRTNLIMHFHCSVCGGVLNVLYGKEAEGVKLQQYVGGSWGPEQHDPEPTGALVRYVEPILVEPCKRCIEKEVGPARELTQAIHKMMPA